MVIFCEAVPDKPVILTIVSICGLPRTGGRVGTGVTVGATGDAETIVAEIVVIVVPPVTLPDAGLAEEVSAVVAGTDEMHPARTTPTMINKGTSMMKRLIVRT